MKKAVLFDLDGTLVNTIIDLGAAVTQILKERDILVSYTEDDYKQMVGNGAHNLMKMAFELAGHTLPADTTPLSERFSEIYSQTLFDHATIYEGIPELISTLQSKGYLLAVITNKPDIHAQEMVNHLFPMGTFSFIVGQQDGTPVKPDPAQVHLALAQMQVSPEEAVYVGDSNTDVQAARNAGMDSIGVDWGFRGEAELRREGADFIAFHPRDIQKIMEKL